MKQRTGTAGQVKLKTQKLKTKSGAIVRHPFRIIIIPVCDRFDQKDSACCDNGSFRKENGTDAEKFDTATVLARILDLLSALYPLLVARNVVHTIQRG